MALYQESLATYKALGDVRSIAVTQSSMADVLSQLGRPQEAMALYQESLATKKALGDVREIAVTQSLMADVLRQLGRPQEAMALYQESLATKKALGDMHGIAVTQANLGQFLLQNDAAAHGLGLLWEAYQTLTGAGYAADAAAVQELLAIVKAQVLGPERFAAVWAELGAGPPPAWLAPAGQSSEWGAEKRDQEAGARIQAIQALVNARSLADKRGVVEAQQRLLLTTVTEDIFTQNIEQARAGGQLDRATGLQQHLDLLRDCRRLGIADAFAAWEEAAAGDAGEEEGADGQETIELPFNPELITQTIAALRSGPQERLAHLQVVQPLAVAAADPALRDFWQAVQMALVGSDVREAGHGLTGVYAALWGAIVAGVTGDGPVDVLDVIVHNTLAVLGPAANQQAAWRADLEQLRERAAAEGGRGLADLAEAVLALLAAEGRAAGLGVGLEGRFAQAWREIVMGLGQRGGRL